MKKVFLCFACWFLLLHASGQSINQSEKSQSYYLKKSKRQKTTGWILLGGGVATTFVGIGVASSELISGSLSGSSNNSSAADVVLLTGLAAMIGSIPVFISAHKNKRRAVAAISFRNQPLRFTDKKSVTSTLLPTVSLKISL